MRVNLKTSGCKGCKLKVECGEMVSRVINQHMMNAMKEIENLMPLRIIIKQYKMKWTLYDCKNHQSG